MKITLCIVAGLATSAGTQIMTMSWDLSETGNGDGLIEPGESAVLTLFAAMDPPATGLAARCRRR